MSDHPTSDVSCNTCKDQTQDDEDTLLTKPACLEASLKEVLSGDKRPCSPCDPFGQGPLAPLLPAMQRTSGYEVYYVGARRSAVGGLGGTHPSWGALRAPSWGALQKYEYEDPFFGAPRNHSRPKVHLECRAILINPTQFVRRTPAEGWRSATALLPSSCSQPAPPSSMPSPPRSACSMCFTTRDVLAASRRFPSSLPLVAPTFPPPLLSKFGN